VEPWKLSAASTLVLREGGKAEAREVLKLAIKELILEGTWRLAKAERPRRLRGPKKVTLLIPGDRPAPKRVPLVLAQSLVNSAHVADWGGTQGREIRAMAKHIALTRPRLRTELIRRVGLDLADHGLADWKERRVLGVERRPKMVRTEAGERALEESRRHEAAMSALPVAKDEADAVLAAAAGLALLSPRSSGGVDGFGGGGFGDVFGGDFDSAFDSSFDSAFDSGYSDGGGDGGGGGNGGGGD
jgi:hypothetical protein